MWCKHYISFITLKDQNLRFFLMKLFSLAIAFQLHLQLRMLKYGADLPCVKYHIFHNCELDLNIRNCKRNRATVEDFQ